jgi:hypothetical protein
MSRCRFIERYRTQDHKITCGPAENGESRTTGPDYDWEDFRSFMTDFRQIAKSKTELVYLKSVIETACQYASEHLREELGKAMSTLIPLMEGKYRGIHVGTDDVSLSSWEVFDALVNGRIFHADRRHRSTVEFLEGNEPWFYLWPLLREIVVPVLQGCMWLSRALREDGILEVSDYPPSAR